MAERAGPCRLSRAYRGRGLRSHANRVFRPPHKNHGCNQGEQPENHHAPYECWHHMPFHLAPLFVSMPTTLCEFKSCVSRTA
jgi:hypothetical protein